MSSAPIPGKPRGIELCTIWGHYTNIYIMLQIRGWSERFRDYTLDIPMFYSFLWKQGKHSGLYHRVLELKYLFGNTYKSTLSGIDKYFLFWEMSVHYSLLLETLLNIFMKGFKEVFIRFTRVRCKRLRHLRRTSLGFSFHGNSSAIKLYVK